MDSLALGYKYVAPTGLQLGSTRERGKLPDINPFPKFMGFVCRYKEDAEILKLEPPHVGSYSQRRGEI
jgi:hypothetical protein